MKKVLSILVSVIILAVSLIFSGCSDFSFNPIGKWVYTDDIMYVDGKEYGHLKKEDMLYEEMSIHFEKSGTGYMEVDGDRTINFTYEYTDEDVTIIYSNPIKNSEEIKTKYRLVNRENRMTLVRTEEDKVKRKDGTVAELKEEWIFEKV